MTPIMDTCKSHWPQPFQSPRIIRFDGMRLPATRDFRFLDFFRPRVTQDVLEGMILPEDIKVHVSQRNQRDVSLGINYSVHQPIRGESSLTALHSAAVRVRGKPARCGLQRRVGDGGAIAWLGSLPRTSDV